MTRILQILFILTLGLILFFWLGDLFLGTSAEVSDRASTEGWVDDIDLYEAETIKSRLWTLLYAVPTIILLVMTVKSITQKSEQLFYWTFLIGLTIFQIIPIAGLLNDKGVGPPFIIPFMLTFLIIFLSGQIFSVYRIAKIRNARQP